MLKKYFFLGAALCSISFAAEARVPYGMAGCGLGSMLFDPDSGQVFASTTNQSTLNQTFGITSGTSNCLESTKAAALTAQQQFMTANYSILSKGAAQGDGDALRAFSNTFGCSKESYSNFAAQMQNSYAKIFTAPGTMAALGAVEDTIKSDANLSHACALAI